MCIIILLTKPTSALSVKRTKLWTDKHAGVSSTHLSLTLSLHLRNLIEIFHAWCIYFRQDLATNMPKSFPKAYQNQWNKKSPTLNWRLRFYRLSATLLLLSSVVEEDGVAELGDGRGRRIFFFFVILRNPFCLRNTRTRRVCCNVHWWLSKAELLTIVSPAVLHCAEGID